MVIWYEFFRLVVVLRRFQYTEREFGFLPISAEVIEQVHHTL